MTRRSITWLVAVALAAGVAFGLYWFTPWRLFTDTTVNETLTAVSEPDAASSSSPSSSSSSSSAGAVPVIVSRGSFITHEHDTSGTVRLLRLPDGTHRLEIEALDTSDGPDLRVWLTDQQVVPGRPGWHLFDDGRYVELGKLKGNKGDQGYAIPAGTDLTGLRSVTIWCKRFSVSFGAAQLAA